MSWKGTGWGWGQVGEQQHTGRRRKEGDRGKRHRRQKSRCSGEMETATEGVCGRERCGEACPWGGWGIRQQEGRGVGRVVVGQVVWKVQKAGGGISILTWPPGGGGR